MKRTLWRYPLTLWVMCRSILLMIIIGFKTSAYAYLGLSTRAWVDQLIQHWVRRILGYANVHCRVFNPHKVYPSPNRPVILMCNHSSLYDIPISFLAFPKSSVRMLAKKELFRIPLMGSGMRGSEFPCIDRQNRQQAMKNLQDVKKLLETGIVLWVAPEGTRSPDGRLGPFKKGAFITAIEMQAIIIPMGIRGANKILPARTFQLHLNQQVEIHIGQAVDATHYTVEERDRLIKDVRDSMLYLVGEI